MLFVTNNGPLNPVTLMFSNFALMTFVRMMPREHLPVMSVVVTGAVEFRPIRVARAFARAAATDDGQGVHARR
jgi:hypothetical protein